MIRLPLSTISTFIKKKKRKGVNQWDREGSLGRVKLVKASEPGLFFFFDDMCKVGFSRLWKRCFAEDEVQSQLFPTLQVQ